MAENISNLEREQTSRSMKPKEFQIDSTQIRLHWGTINYQKSKNKEYWKQKKRKLIQEAPHKTMVTFSTEMMQAMREQDDIFKMLEKASQPRTLFLAKLSLEIKERKTFQKTITEGVHHH